MNHDETTLRDLARKTVDQLAAFRDEERSLGERDAVPRAVVLACGDHRQAVRDPPDYLSPFLEHGEILTRFGTLAARIISVADGRSGEGGASTLQNNDIVRALETIATLMEIKDEAYYRVLGL